MTENATAETRKAQRRTQSRTGSEGHAMPEGNVSPCPRCGSDKIIPDVPLPDHFGDAGGFSRDAQIEVHGAPRAWVFTNTAAGKLSLRVCGNCGHAELFVGNFRELYERYQQSRKT